MGLSKNKIKRKEKKRNKRLADVRKLGSQNKKFTSEEGSRFKISFLSVTSFGSTSLSVDIKSVWDWCDTIVRKK